MRNLLIVLVYILAAPACALGIFIMAMWLSDHTHEFGPWDPRYLLLIQGTQVGKLDLVEPIVGSVGFVGKGQEGTAPAYARVAFKTKAMPEKVIDVYSTRCPAIGLAAQRQPRDQQKLGLTCQREGAEVVVAAARLRDVTEVTINGWEFE